jgi:hypothetical protein
MVDFARQLMPASIFNQVIRLAGVRMSWMKSHACPCTMASDIPGSPDPACNTCHGRGRWWETPVGPFVLLRTFMHTSEATDEPGAMMDPRVGQMLHAEPTITIPSNVLPLWSEAAEFDAFVEEDTLTRFETAFIVGQPAVLPYQQNLTILNVVAYNTDTKSVLPLDVHDWNYDGTQVNLVNYDPGTAFTVMYKASPVYICWRRAGANPHTRPFGAGSDPLPVRFRAQLLDLWLRSRNPHFAKISPQSVSSVNPF